MKAERIKRAQPEETSFAKPCHLEGNFGVARVVCSLAFKKMYPASAALGQGERLELRPSPSLSRGRGSPVPAPPQLPTRPPPYTLRRMFPCPSPNQKKKKKSAPRPRPNGPQRITCFAAKIKCKWKGKIRRFQAEQPDSNREGKKALSKRGSKSELQGNADSNAEKIPFLREAGSGARRGGPGEPVRSGAVAGELRRARAAGPGRRREACGLQDAFGAVRLAGCRKRARRAWQLQH